jgi:GntR family transcriptional repressor for pyruvate dehydrogenase complex
LAESVAQQLLREIREKQLPQGTRLPSERDLMASMGVGRSTIREAINGLAMLGVVEIRHGQGAFVADSAAGSSITPVLARALAHGVTEDLFEARRLIEVHVARLAAERRTESDLRELEEALSDYEAAMREGRLAVEASVRFHMKIAEAAHSELLAGFVASMGEILGERGPALESMPGFRQWELEQHRSVFAPIRAGDPDAAAEKMLAHLEAVFPHHERMGLA